MLYKTTYEDLKKISSSLTNLFSNVKNYTYISSYEIESYKNKIDFLYKSIKEVVDEFILNKKYDYLDSELIDYYLSDLSDKVHQLDNFSTENNVLDCIVDIYGFFEKIEENLSSTLKKVKTDEVLMKMNTLDEGIKNVAELKEQIKNQETHDIYALAAKENQKRSDDFRMAFILLIIVAIIFIWFCAITKTYFGLKDYDYWFFKGTLVLTSVTLITYFLKQSVKYQKIADQCRQTKMELEAFPSFVASFTTEDPKIIEIRRELALKYFGRELDSTTKDDTGGIIAEQMRSTTEMVKATTEAIKNLKGS